MDEFIKLALDDDDGGPGLQKKLTAFLLMLVQMGENPDFKVVKNLAKQNFGVKIESGLLKELEKEFAECNKSVDGRFGFFRRCFPWEQVCGSDCYYSCKSNKNSKDKREEGNEKYKNQDLKGALADYNRAVAFAPLNSQSLALAFANRGAVLMGLRQPFEAIQDIDRALQSGNYPSNKRDSLAERRSRCIEMLELIHQVVMSRPKRSAEMEVDRKKKADRVAGKKFYDKILFSLKSPQSTEPAMDECIEVREDSFGKYLVVSQDVPAGTTLIVDKPLFTVVPEVLDSTGEYCNYCLKKLFGGIPCHDCVVAFYCDENCRLKAQAEFHGKYECPCMSYYGCCAVASDVPPSALLFLRILSKLGPTHFYKLYQTRLAWFSEAAKGHEKLWNLKNKTGLIDSDYLKVYRLISPPQSLLPPSHRLGHLIQAKMMIEALEKKTDFFQAIPSTELKAFREFLKSLGIQHIQSPLIALPLRESCGNYSTKDFTEGADEFSPERLEFIRSFVNALGHFVEMKEFGAGIYPVASMVRQGCDSNVVLQPGANPAGGKMAVVSSRGLRQGEVLMVNFGGHFLYAPKETRRELLKERFFMDCNCVACRGDWPELEDLVRIFEPRWCCPRCSRHFTYEQKGMPELTEIVLRPPLVKCWKCKNAYNQEKFDRQMDVIRKKSGIIMFLLVEQLPYEILRAALDVLKLHHQDLICPPYLTAVMHQEVLKGALAHIVMEQQQQNDF